MFEMKIADINLTMPVNDFEQELKNHINNHSEPMNYELKQLSTRMGKHMYKLIIDNDNGSDISIVGERDDISGDIIFHPLKLSNMNDSFYNIYYADGDIINTDVDPAVFMRNVFCDLCSTYKGSFACITPSGSTILIKDGSNKKVSSIGIIDIDGNVYSCAGAKNIKGAGDSSSFSVNKPIGEWLKENPDIQRELAKHPQMDAKMNYIGKYLINAKLKEEIDSDEFMDIFCQAGIIGFSEPSVLNIYKLIM